MLLVDSEIKTFVTNGKLGQTNQTSIIDGDASCITNIGYDLRADRFAREKKLVESCELQPGESSFVQSKEIISFDKDTVGKVVLKNSRIRMGLTLDAPVYQPGHKTRIFFRLTNVSNDAITLTSGEKYAMLMFEQLHKSPDVPYTGTFEGEFSFKGMADYQSEYADQIKSIDGKIKNLQDLEKSIYGNVITILSIFVAIFTLLNINIDLSNQNNDGAIFLVFNLATLGAISFLAVFLSFLLNKEAKPDKKLWFIPAICFLSILIIIIILHLIPLN